MTFHEMVVVKVGGSLFDLPDLARRLRAWLAELDGASALLVPGGGRTADVVREMDRQHALGEQTAHKIALKALEVNALFLAALVPESTVVEDPGELLTDGCQGRVAVLAPYSFALKDDGLPHSWEATSDSVAMRVAVVLKLRRLILLKSVDVPPHLDWREASRQGIVDVCFAEAVGQAPDLQISAVNFRNWQPRSAKLPASGPERR